MDIITARKEHHRLINKMLDYWEKDTLTEEEEKDLQKTYKDIDDLINRAAFFGIGF